MKTRNYFKAAAMMAMVLFASCSKEEIKDTQDNGLITLEVPALQSFNGNGNGQAQSRIAFDIPADGSVPKVRWEVGDKIYIGKIDADTKSGEILQNLITNGDFTVFTCTSVRGDNKATFQGEKLVAGSNLAVYTEKPDKVNAYITTGMQQFGFQCLANEKVENESGVIINGDDSHLAGNDLLVSLFNETDKTLYFRRAFSFVQFVLKLPEGVTGVTRFECNQIRVMARIYAESDGQSIGTSFHDASGRLDVTLQDFTVENGTLSFYSLAPRLNLKANTNITYKFTGQDGTVYTKIMSYTEARNIYPYQAVKINVDFTTGDVETTPTN